MNHKNKIKYQKNKIESVHDQELEKQENDK
jgi:hypothetical protein